MDLISQLLTFIQMTLKSLVCPNFSKHDIQMSNIDTSIWDIQDPNFTLFKTRLTAFLPKRTFSPSRNLRLICYFTHRPTLNNLFYFYLLSISANSLKSVVVSVLLPPMSYLCLSTENLHSPPRRSLQTLLIHFQATCFWDTFAICPLKNSSRDPNCLPRKLAIGMNPGSVGLAPNVQPHVPSFPPPTVLPGKRQFLFLGRPRMFMSSCLWSWLLPMS